MQLNTHPMIKASKPFLRWWWFSGSIDYEEIDEQLDWIQSKGFGGVELAWVFPLYGTSAGDGPEFLDDEWQSYVSYTVVQCNLRGLGCDLTFGTLWPFGGNFIPVEHSSRTFKGFSSQRLERSWESRYSKKPGLILDHLDSKAFTFYADHLLAHGFRSCAKAAPLTFFSDSWEVETEELAYQGIFENFRIRFGYDLEPYVKTLSQYPAVRYDYRKEISDRILENFYIPYVDMCRKTGSLSRMQCHGTPADILAAYALVDIPETETLLFDPDFALIAASAAAIWKKPVVSSETFSCIYGWVPNTEIPPGIGEERVEDLRCVADAQFAWGVNRVIWHGKPYSTRKMPQKFYASVHLGADGRLNDSLPAFNNYLEKVSSYMSRGKTYTSMAVYLPLEDSWMLDALPAELEKPSSHYHWELQELHLPDELLPYRPVWFSGSWLKDLEYDGVCLKCGDQEFPVFYCDAQWMEFEHLERLTELTSLGAPILWKRFPKEPGFKKNPNYNKFIKLLQNIPLFSLETVTPILSSEIPLDFWCRKEDNYYYLFISHPKMRKLRYPLPIDYYTQVKPITVQAEFYSARNTYNISLSFPQAGSLLYCIDDINHHFSLIDLHHMDINSPGS